MKKNGFTLIELLAVIVILGVLLGIAVPSITKYITNSKKEGLISSGKFFVDSVRNDITSETYSLPISNSDVTIITLDFADMEKSKEKSSFGGKYIFNKSYVAVVNVGTPSEPEYGYYFAVQDSKDYAVPLTEESKMDIDKVVAKAKNKMEVTIQSLCGSEDGFKKEYSTISGLEEIQLNDENGDKLSWSATIYSSERCASNESE